MLINFMYPALNVGSLDKSISQKRSPKGFSLKRHEGKYFLLMFSSVASQYFQLLGIAEKDYSVV